MQWQRGSIFLADQKLAIDVPRVRDREAGRELPLATYAIYEMLAVTKYRLHGWIK